MLRAYDFSCPTHGRFEAIVTIPPLETGVWFDSRRDIIPPESCPKCGEASPRIESNRSPMMAPKYIVAAGDIRKRARN